MEEKEICDICMVYPATKKELCDSCHGVLTFMKKEAKRVKLSIEEYLIKTTKF